MSWLRRRAMHVLGAAVAAVLIVMAVISFTLWRQARMTHQSERAAERGVAAAAEQYRRAVGAALSPSKTITGADLSALRDGNVRGRAGANAQGIGLVGAHQGGGHVIVTFMATRQYGGGWSEGNASRCYRVDVVRAGAAASATLVTITCDALEPAIADTAILRLSS